MTTAAMFRKALEALPSVSFPHRKVRADGKVIDSVAIPVVVLEAVKSASRIETQSDKNRAKARFERLVLESVLPGASQGLDNSQVTSVVSHVCDAWFPKDEGEFKTHPISREVPEGSKSPSAYFWKEEATPSPEGGVRCAPRPFRSESVDVESLSPESLAKKANDEEMGRLLRGEITPVELVEAVKTRLSKPKAQKVDEAAIADIVAKRVLETLQKMGITPPSAE